MPSVAAGAGARRKVAPFGAEVGSRLSHGPRLVRSSRGRYTSHPNPIALDDGIKIATATVLRKEGVEVAEQGHGSESAGAPGQCYHGPHWRASFSFIFSLRSPGQSGNAFRLCDRYRPTSRGPGTPYFFPLYYKGSPHFFVASVAE